MLIIRLWLVILLLWVPTTALTIEEEDALRALYLAWPTGFQSVGWNYSDLANACAPPDPFAGLTCNNNSNVVALTISLPNSGNIATEIGLLTYLTKIDWTRQSFSRQYGTLGSIPTQIGQLSLLQSLIFQEMPFTGTFPTQIGLLSALFELKILSSQLSGTVPTELGRLTLLLNLVLERSFLSELPTTALSPSLISVNLRQNTITGTLPMISHMPLLFDMDLQRNSFSGTIPPHYLNSSNLQALELSSNKLSGTIPPIQNSVLYLLGLAQNQLSGPIPDMPLTMITLDLSENLLVGSIPSSFQNLTRLAFLGLTNNLLSGTIPMFPTQHRIVSIFLGQNQFSGTVPTDILSPRTISLQIQRNQLSGTLPTEVCDSPFLQFFLFFENRFIGSPVFTGISLETVMGFNNYFQSSKILSKPTFVILDPQNPYCDSVLNISCSLPNTVCQSPDCVCAPGYEFNDNKTSCIDIDECLTGLWQSRRSSNTNTSCSFKYQCINQIGSFFCCPDGYEVDTAGTGCQDINECIAGSKLTNDCATKPSTFCQNTLGGFQCNPCADGEFLQVDDTKAGAIKSLAVFNTSGFAYHHCFGSCENGFRVFGYSPIEAVATCSTQFNLSKILCQYPCTNQVSLDTEASVIEAIRTELNRDRFIDEVFEKLFNATIIFTRKRLNSLSMQVNPCNTSQITAMTNMLNSLALEITPNAPTLSVTMDPSCAATISSQNGSQNNNLAIIIGSVVGGVALILIVLLIVYFLMFDVLSQLPSEVAWSYKQYKWKPLGWQYRGSSSAGYHFKELEKNTEFYSKAMALFDGYDNPLTSKSSKNNLVEGIFAVYNPVLVRNFIGNYRIAQSRSERAEFNTKKWKEGKEEDARQFVFSEFEKRCRMFDWNTDSNAPILPMFHGTSMMVAEKICESGFAALSSLDAGFYGKGIYFTSHKLYTIPYVVTKRQPAIILSWVIPGNVYPVIESHKGDHSLSGTALKSGYSSHYVLTTKKGDVISSTDTTFCDELVVSQESQITPAYIFVISEPALQPLVKEWMRSTAPTKNKHPIIEVD